MPMGMFPTIPSMLLILMGNGSLNLKFIIITMKMVIKLNHLNNSIHKMQMGIPLKLIETGKILMAISLVPKYLIIPVMQTER